MPLTVYNSLTRKKEPFETVIRGKVGMYLCGPTVYKPSHIGHAVGPIIFDAIKRYLSFRGYEVTWVVNITDVDDKLIDEAGKQNCTTMQLAERITKDYLKAMSILHVDGIDIMPKASEHIREIIDITQKLIDKGHAYVSGGDVYFDVTRDADYGKLSNRKTEEQSGQRDLKSGEKRNPGDFALWKAAKPEEPADVKFDSPWGPGRPGWHIECSAMASRYLGETFDIHGGGLDLIFPHHENEVAQSECANGKTFAKYWMHHGLTRVNTKKISKSDASPEMQAALARMTLHNLLAEYPGELVRFFVLSTQYRRPIEYTPEEFDSKRKGLDTFYRLFERVDRLAGCPYKAADAAAKGSRNQGIKGSRESEQGTKGTREQGNKGSTAEENLRSQISNIKSAELRSAMQEAFDRFTEAMDDDFNTAGAIAALFDYAGAINRFIELNKIESGEASGHVGQAGGRSGEGAASIENQQSTIDHRAQVLAATAGFILLGRLIGLFIEPQQKSAGKNDTADRAMQVLIKIRQHLRKKKDFETADLIRNLLTEQKITLEDRPDGTIWRAE